MPFLSNYYYFQRRMVWIVLTLYFQWIQSCLCSLLIYVFNLSIADLQCCDTWIFPPKWAKIYMQIFSSRDYAVLLPPEIQPTLSSKVIQWYTHTYTHTHIDLFYFQILFGIGYYKTLSMLPCATQLTIYFIHSNHIYL